MQSLNDFLTSDHERVDALLSACVRADGSVDPVPYDEFRRGLLRHISIEERVLFPELRKRRGTTELEKQLHRDHAALVSLLVPPPTSVEIGQIVGILQSHNPLEEGEGGLYSLMEALDIPDLMERVHAIPAVPVMPNIDTPLVRTTIEQLLRERGR